MLSLIVPKEQAYYRGRELCKSSRNYCRGRYEIAIQAAIGSKIIARKPLGFAKGCDRKVLRRGHHKEKLLRNRRKERKG